MSQKLSSAEFYQEPDEGEFNDPLRGLGSKNRLQSAKWMVSLVFWMVLIGVGGLMTFRAVVAVNQPKVYAGSGGHPALNMLSFCMNLVDWDWDNRVEKHIQENSRTPRAKPEIPNLPPYPGPEIESFGGR